MSKTNKIMLWGAGGVAAAMLALTGYAVFSDDDTPSRPGTAGGGSTPTASPTPTPSYTVPDEWTEPGKWVALPRGKHVDDQGNAVGFPHTIEGAVAMLAASNSTVAEGGRTIVDEQLGTFESYMARVDQTPKNRANIRAQAARTDAAFRRNLGIPTEADMPSGAYARTHVVGFKVIKASRNEVSAYLLSRVTTKAGEMEKEGGSYTRTVLAAEWQSSDWKLSSAAIIRAAREIRGQQKPTMAAPGDEAFNRAGWTAIRDAS